jgi:tRNA (cytidine/uridine-2'-O-)-methyltransferase
MRRFDAPTANRYAAAMEPTKRAAGDLAPPEPHLHVALVFPEIPGNAGNVGRTCLAVGARLHLIEPLGFSLADRFLKRAGLDYWVHVDLVVWKDWPTFEAALPGLGKPFAFTAEARRELWQVEFPPAPQGTVLLFGREGGGLPPEIRQAYRGDAVRIPMRPGTPVRSLNLSTAVGIGVYAALRGGHG